NLRAVRDLRQPSRHAIHRLVRDFLRMGTAAICQDGDEPSAQLLVPRARKLAVRAQLPEQYLELLRVQPVRHVTSTRPAGRSPPSKTGAPSACSSTTPLEPPAALPVV